ncbi:hypothetical protein PFLUV_G00038750 [Perca fluviatilis]|uniref:WH2 domain-containing protein n=1 Tax=Perca fluviatilis TaxID=8168 RepID=A0A6A5F822_PERFL|nr:hypothetical protein PFLUV_G00038750 [Perca fluviatilis]
MVVDYESISLHGDADSISLHHLSHGNSQSDFDKSSTIPRNSDLSFQYRKFAQSKRPASTVSLLAEPDLFGRSGRPLASNTATIRRKPSSKPAYRRGTISGGVPIPICTPQVPLKAVGAGNGNDCSDENVFAVPSPVEAGGGLGFSKLCSSTQSLSALAPFSPYYQLVPGHMPIPVPVPTVPSLPPEGSSAKQQQQQRLYQQQLQQQQQQQINQQLNHHQHHSQLQQHNQQLQIQQQQQQLQQQLQHQQQLQQHQQQLQQQFQHQQQQLHHQQQLQQQFQHQQSLRQQPHDQYELHQDQQLQAQFQASTAQGEASSLGHSAHCQPLAPPPSSQHPDPDLDPEPLTQEGPGNMLTQIRGVKLKRTLTNDRSAPLLPPPTNHK